MTAADFQKSIIKKQRPKIRLPKERKPNATEAEYMRELSQLTGYRVLFEPLTLLLPSGTKYTPDIMTISHVGAVVFYEVKGPHIHNPASLLRFKEARRAFPFWRFVFAQKLASGWTTAE